MIEPYWQSDDGRYTVYCADCLDVLPQLDGIDAVVTDPPYGIADRWDKKQMIGKRGKSRLWGQNNASWDKATQPQEVVDLLLGVSSQTVIWGGNYYSLPASRGWLIWDKCQTFSGSEAELAWTNLPIPVRTFRLSRIDAYVNTTNERKQHPTQKPLCLMEWCLSFIPNAQTVLDPFTGSGTTGVACVNTGRRFIGIEIDETYAKIAVKRIQDALAQLPLVERSG